jgi:methylenetetrahydrofolate--tRNA-(uracil-5-)-methyltransferase
MSAMSPQTNSDSTAGSPTHAADKKPVHVIGAGMAGSEAAWQLARFGVPVILHEQKPERFSPAHKSPGFAELVCSNSFKSNRPENPAGVLKAELRQAGSLLIPEADKAAVPAGEALAVDRDVFSAGVTAALEAHPLVTIDRREVTAIPDDGGLVIVATGPLTSDALAEGISRLIGRDRFYFCDAISPIVETESIDMDHAFKASRNNKTAGLASLEGVTEAEGDYINCPLTEAEYHTLVGEILKAEKVAAKSFEEAKFFEGCLPLEVMAERGPLTLAFAAWKPVGLVDPRTQAEPFAVIQLRAENRELTAYSMVACQTRLTWPEQKRVFTMIPALRNAQFVRLGSVHRNTYIDAPRLLGAHWQARSAPHVRFAGQILGVEGYLESTYAGFLCGLMAVHDWYGLPFTPPPPETAVGALYKFVREGAPGAPRFDPVNIHTGLFPPLEGRPKRGDRKAAVAARAQTVFTPWWEETKFRLTRHGSGC